MDFDLFSARGWPSEKKPRFGPAAKPDPKARQRKRMDSITHPPIKSQIPLRALVEIRGGELCIFPIAQTDAEADRVLDALRFLSEGWAER